MNKLEVQYQFSKLNPKEVEGRLFLALSQLIKYEDLDNNFKKYEKRKRVKKG